MKKALVLFTFLLSFAGIGAFAQQRTDFKGHVIDSKGDVYFDGIQIGKVTKDGKVMDMKGKKIAYVGTNGDLVDANGKKMGRVGKDGKSYADASGNVMLTVEENPDKQTCNILDAQGKVIGNVHSSYKGMACSVHCFEHNMDMKDHSKH